MGRPGESVASFIDAKGELKEGEWKLDESGRWVMIGDGAKDDDALLRGSIALSGIQVETGPAGTCPPAPPRHNPTPRARAFVASPAGAHSLRPTLPCDGG